MNRPPNTRLQQSPQAALLKLIVLQLSKAWHS